ncbi:MAG: hypothetical protein RLY58_1076 [Pseudomonadota bacterium]|jgi:hypothetical protein
MSTVRKFRQGVAVIASTAFLLSGCSQIYKTGANLALRFTENHFVPPIVAMDDTQMVCESGTALTPLIVSTQALGADPTKMAVLLYAGAGLCAEKKALEQELTYLRSARDGKVEVAQDARIAQKRWAEIAARRQFAGYQMFAEKWERDYKIKLGDQCPTMRTDLDKTIYLLGMVSGLQAVTNDINAQGAVNVPKDIAAVVERGMKCLDNEKFWGTPMAIRAAIWTLLPGASEGKPDPFQTMKDATRIGERTGVRLPHAIYALAAQATGKDELIRDALRTYGNSIEQKMPVNPKYRLFDAMGGELVMGISDRYWTEKTGTRTPDGGLLRFWDEKATDDSGINVDDLI